MKIADLLAGEDSRVQSIRELVSQEAGPVQAKEAFEDTMESTLPGDDPSQHAMYRAPCPYLHFPRATLRKLLDEVRDPQIREDLRYAMKLQSLDHAG